MSRVGRYKPIAQIEATDPVRAENIRKYFRLKARRLRAADPDRSRAMGRSQYAKNRERASAIKRAWRDENRDKIKASKEKAWVHRRAAHFVQHIRHEARRKGVAFDLTLEWFEARLEKGECELSGLPFDMSGKKSPSGPSVDRIRAGGPYTQDNCRLIFISLNIALSNLGEDYMLNVFRHVLARREA